MISTLTKEMFEKLELPYPVVALKYHVCKPKGVEQYKGDKLAFCQYVKYTQDHKGTYYITAENDACYGKMSLGMIPKPPVTASGQAGADFEVYASPAGCRKLYQELPVIEPGTVNYVQFSQLDECDFDPDMLMVVANLEKADIIMHATSYLTGDFWESKSSPVISCAWMYAYPVISGKVNHITTGYYHGLRRRKAYPAGMEMIAIPFQKIDLVTLALQRMPWTTIAFREDEESKAELKRRMDNWQNMAKELNSTVDLH
jgi:uncharacterized protein (DUF169 family)